MAGLGVLLEAHETLHKNPQIISKATILSSSSSHSSASPPPRLPTAGSSFLESCYLCGQRLSQGKDIYMYRGDRAFCSVDCRCRQIAMDEESVRRENCGGAASRRRGKVAGKARAAAGGFAY